MAFSALKEQSTARLEALRNKHRMLSQRIEDAQKSPGYTVYDLTLLKKQKLRLKEEISGIRASG